MVAQTYYTIPSTGIYRSANGKHNYYFYEDDQIPMELAVLMGMDGAALPDPDPHFTADEQAAIVSLAGGGGVPSLLLTYNTRDYDNRTAAGGAETTYTIFDFTMVGGLIKIEEEGKQISQFSFRVTTAAVGATALLSFYGINESTAQYRGLPGTQLYASSSIAVATTGLKTVAPVAVPVDPGLYWVLIEPSAEITIAGFQSHGGHLGVNATTGAVYSGCAVNIDGEPLDPHPASINGGDRAAVAPWVAFRLQDVP